MKKPVLYMQNDAKWKSHDYSTAGERKTIGNAGCGPTCAAMVIASLKDKNINPVTTAEWSMEHGYKALNQGTYYSYFVPQFKEYGIEARQLNSTNVYKIPNNIIHNNVKTELIKGNWVVACMGVGLWTKNGHFVLAYGIDGLDVLIRDPASTAQNRIKNKLSVWQNEVKYYWVVQSNQSMNDNSNSIKVNLYKEPTANVRMKDRGESVRWLQWELNNHGYNCGVVDGIYGVKTDKALRDFQKDNNLVIDGICGIKTRTTLKLR